MTGKDHATAIWSIKQVKNKLEIRDRYYIEAINNWAVVFNEVMPKDVNTMWSVQDRIRATLDTTLLNDESKVEILQELLKIYSEDVVNV